MDKSELIDTIANDSGLSRADATRAVNSLTTTVAMILNKGEEVTITGFGKFSVPNRAARTGRNPQTSKPSKIRASKTPRFAGLGHTQDSSRRPPQVTNADVLFTPASPVERPVR